MLLDQEGIEVNAEDRFGATALDDAMREQLADQPIVRALLVARGGREGSKQPLMPVLTTHTEELKADIEASQIEVQRTVTEEARHFHTWVHEQRAATLALSKSVEKALALEQEQGEVLSDALPRWWSELQRFCAKHPARVQMVRETLRPALASWSSRAQENRFDIAMISDLESRVDVLIELLTAASRSFERLTEADFQVAIVPSAAVADEEKKRYESRLARARSSH
jgi:hypothetical protein